MRIALLAAGALLAVAGAASAQMPAPKDIVAAWDSDKDGSVSKAEWTAAGRPAERFDVVDADKDGKITVAELEAAFKAMQQQRGG
jgi:Ca2+-binding EF-hand superfamily protein